MTKKLFLSEQRKLVGKYTACNPWGVCVYVCVCEKEREIDQV